MRLAAAFWLAPLGALAQPIVPASPPHAPGVAVAPPVRPSPPPRAPEPAERFFASFSAGIGGPLGGSTLPFGLSEDPGVIVALGYLATPWLAAQLFAHYNQTSIALGDEDGATGMNDGDVDTNDGSVGLFGGEVRLRRSGRDYGAWIAAGLAFGGARLKLEADGLDEPILYEVDFGPTPVVSFGAEVRLGDVIRLGPEARWYFVTVQRACETREGGFSFFRGGVVPDRPPPDDGYAYGDGGYYGEPPPEPASVSGARVRVCTDTTEGESVPDAFYLGLGITVFLN